VRNTVPELSFKAVSLGLALFTSAIAPALADEPACPDSTVASSVPLPAKSTRPPTDAPITIESDDNNFQFDVNGNAKLCGHVEMRQGDRIIRADCLEYNAASQNAKLTGGVEFSDPTLTVRGNSGTYSPSLGADFEGTQFELPSRGARGSATRMRLDGQSKITLDGVTFTTCPANVDSWDLEAKQIELDTQARDGTGHGTPKARNRVGSGPLTFARSVDSARRAAALPVRVELVGLVVVRAQVGDGLHAGGEHAPLDEP